MVHKKMEISWANLDGEENTAKVEASLRPIIDAVGIHVAAEFLLYFRGRYFYVGSNRRKKVSAASKLFGAEEIGRISEALTNAGYGYQNGKSYRVPSATAFLSRYLRSKGLKVAEIANRLGTTDVTVGKHLKSEQERQRLREHARRRQLDQAIEEAVSLGLVVRVKQPQKAAL
ncbi:hypothetical protein SAMN05880590_107149 [Rhizobium sp. RU35A]|uniref:hypothetical protein n=1 Tax=Rhizobium sp. RU35A TaxID=1907414 RepID=UPI000953B8F7|nr:hypothetical protein [Rhizobium sp. RU35A]SIQ78100.1 hypothetical protein SAMN05880590_107149 [Rhizobium sp. RU35A]